MSVDYNSFAKTFSNSRKNMKWEEIEYFLSFLSEKENLIILDIWCWNGRFLWELNKNNLDIKSYLGVDLSDWLLDEAKKTYPNNKFQELDMLNLEKVNLLSLIKGGVGGEFIKFSDIFFIASLHHLKTIEERINVLKQAYDLLEENGKIFMTNWALKSELNIHKYNKSIIKDSRNEFGWEDYNIKIWKFDRYYHCFSIEELNYLFSKAWFKIIENKLFENNRNYVSIISK